MRFKLLSVFAVLCALGLFFYLFNYKEQDRPQHKWSFKEHRTKSDQLPMRPKTIKLPKKLQAKPINKQFEQLKSFNDCLRSTTCNYDNSDSRSYFLAIDNEKRDLFVAMIRSPYISSRQLVKELPVVLEMASSRLKIHVLREALASKREKKFKDQFFEEVIKDEEDPYLITNAFKAILQLENTRSRHQKIASLILQGPFFVAMALVDHLDQFMFSDHKNIYEDVYAQLDPDNLMQKPLHRELQRHLN